jgi:hypothetical protein
MEQPRLPEDPAHSMAELAAALRDMRDAFVNMSLLMKDHLFELEASQHQQNLASPPPAADRDPLP